MKTYLSHGKTFAQQLNLGFVRTAEFQSGGILPEPAVAFPVVLTAAASRKFLAGDNTENLSWLENG